MYSHGVTSSMYEKAAGKSIAPGLSANRRVGILSAPVVPLEAACDPQQLRRNCEAFPKSCSTFEKTVQRQATCDFCRETLPRMKQVAAERALWLMNVLQRFAAPGLLFMAGQACGALSAPACRQSGLSSRVDGQERGT
jgi:hypothetical protein